MKENVLEILEAVRTLAKSDFIHQREEGEEVDENYEAGYLEALDNVEKNLKRLI